MKPQEVKDNFIAMRAQGKSYSYIADKLHISKSTCTAWERELQNEISIRKSEQLEQLYNSYFMTREARIKKLGAILEKIDGALNRLDFDKISPERLLDYKLKYTQALKEEYIAIGRSESLPDDIKPSTFIEMLKDLLDRVQNGLITTKQAARESMILSNLLKAYEQTELQGKIEALETIVEGRT